jgi:hypothetical protein
VEQHSLAKLERDLIDRAVRPDGLTFQTRKIADVAETKRSTLTGRI